jgi:hypothetical protein
MQAKELGYVRQSRFPICGLVTPLLLLFGVKSFGPSPPPNHSSSPFDLVGPAVALVLANVRSDVIFTAALGIERQELSEDHKRLTC